MIEGAIDHPGNYIKEKKMNYYIYLDDIREDDSYFNKNFSRKEWIPFIVRNYCEAVEIIEKFFLDDKIFLDLDHDLGFDNDNEELNGYDLCKYIIQKNISPYKFHIHSMNPVGAMNMRQLLTHYGWEEV